MKFVMPAPPNSAIGSCVSAANHITLCSFRTYCPPCLIPNSGRPEYYHWRKNRGDEGKEWAEKSGCPWLLWEGLSSPIFKLISFKQLKNSFESILLVHLYSFKTVLLWNIIKFTKKIVAERIHISVYPLLSLPRF